MIEPSVTSNGHCTDVLLSFLTDVGEDWSESFIFPGSEVSRYIDIDDYLSKEEFKEHQAIKESSIHSSSSSSNVAGTIVTQSSGSADEMDFDESIDNLFSPFAEEGEILTLDDMFADATNVVVPPAYSGKQSLNTSHRSGFEESSLQATSTQFKIKPEFVLQSSQIGLKRERNDEPMVEDPRNVKATVPQKVTAVCSMLNQYRAVKRESEERDRKMANKRFRYNTPIDTATTYLQSLFNSKPVSPQELLKLSSSNSVLHCKALSSLVTNSQSKRAMAKLSAWIPPSSMADAGFPENHTGIGQTAAASRAFTSAMNDVLGQSLMSKLRFNVHIPKANAIISKHGDRLSAPFVFKSEGMIAMGHSREIEFNGFITCNFVKEGISDASVYFDACKIIRDQHQFAKPLSTVAAVL